MVRLPVSLQSATALALCSAPERQAAVEAAFPAAPPVASRYARRRYYAELERGGELYILPLLAMSLEEAAEQARLHCRGRGYRFERVDPRWTPRRPAGGWCRARSSKLRQAGPLLCPTRRKRRAPSFPFRRARDFSRRDPAADRA